MVAPGLRFMGTGKDRFPGNKLGMVRENEEPKKKTAELKIEIEQCREMLSPGPGWISLLILI